MRKVAVLACILSLLVPAVLLVGCGSGSSSQTPEGMAQTFWTAMVKQDFNTSWSLMSAEYQKMATESQFAAAFKNFMTTNVPSGTKVTYGKATINGNKGTITVTFNVGGITHPLHMPVIKENGVWKVDGTKMMNQ